MSDNSVLSGNIGEWSELYVFFKLLAEKKLYAANAELEKIEDTYYPVIKILNKDPLGEYEYHTNSVIKIIDSKGTLIDSIPIQKFKDNALILLNKLKSKPAQASFKITALSSFLSKIKISKIKAKSSEKRDITIVVHDMFTGINPKLGFSVKSQIGGDSTLFNASQQTNFVYEITCNKPLTELEIDSINHISSRGKIKDRINSLFKHGCILKFQKIDSSQLTNNLIIVDSALPQMLSEMLIGYYSGKENSVVALTKILIKKNPLKFDLSTKQPFYEYKIKNLLTDIALGMTPKTPWNGIYDANGGYIIVKENGEVLCYHIYNRNEFQEYLFRNTKFETPSSGRNKFGEIYKKDNKLYIKLNLQIRFL